LAIAGYIGLVSRHKQALRRLKRTVNRLGQTTGWDAPARKGSILARLAEEGESVRDTMIRLVVERYDQNDQPVLSANGIKRLARLIKIQDHELPRDVLWKPFQSQMDTWDLLCRELWCNIMKSRQVGVTLATLLFDIIWTAVRDAKGYWVECALIWDTRDKVGQIMHRCSSMVRQLGIPLRKRPSTLNIRFPSGSALQARWASSKGATRGLSYHRYHCSEVPFWRDASKIWEAMRPSLNLGAPVTFESTMKTATDRLASDLWKKPNKFGGKPPELGGFSHAEDGKMFLSVEGHKEYRRDPADIPENQWEWLRDDEGFRRRDTAAWWYRKLIDEANEDVHVMMREYPMLPRHCFAVSEGRFVKKDPEILEAPVTYRVTSSDGTRVFKLQIFVPPEETSAQIRIGVDTAGGTGGDACAATAVDAEDRRIVAAISSEWIDIYDYRDSIAKMWEVFNDELVTRRREGERHLRDVTTRLVVETNGPLGSKVANLLEEMNLPVRRFTTGSPDDGTRDAILTEARLYVENGTGYGPERLNEECEQLHRLKKSDGTDGGWRGHDDVLMSYGIALLDIQQDPYVEEDVRTPEQRRRAELMQLIEDEEEWGHGERRM
jgi:hypothetical protein